jgi:hypothetical protein
METRRLRFRPNHPNLSDRLRQHVKTIIERVAELFLPPFDTLNRAIKRLDRRLKLYHALNVTGSMMLKRIDPRCLIFDFVAEVRSISGNVARDGSDDPSDRSDNRSASDSPFRQRGDIDDHETLAWTIAETTVMTLSSFSGDTLDRPIAPRPVKTIETTTFRPAVAVMMLRIAERRRLRERVIPSYLGGPPLDLTSTTG